MRHTLLVGGLLLAAPLSIAASPIDMAASSNQLVFAQSGEGDATSASAVASNNNKSPHREPDLVDQMLAEAQSKGEDLRQWGIEIVDGQAQAMDDSARAQWQKEQEAEAEAENVFLEVSEFTKDLVADLSDDFEKARLVMEAAMDDAVFSILPISKEKVHQQAQKQKSVHSDVDAMDGPPGSGWIWSVCGSRDEAIVLDDIKVLPDPPKPGENLTVHAVGEVKHDLKEGSYADVVVKLGFIRLLSRRFDICQLAKDNDAELQCPLEPGHYEITHTVELPKEIPPAKFNVHVNGKTQDDVDLMCMDVSIDFMHH